MAKYHKYVFDKERRQFVGDFEKMYSAEKKDSFDSWHQTDSRNLTKKFCNCILNQYNFNKIIDIGCGKGAFTHMLKRNNNYVIGLDVSKTAIRTAKSHYPDIDFVQLDAASEDFESNMYNIAEGGGGVDFFC